MRLSHLCTLPPSIMRELVAAGCNRADIRRQAGIQLSLSVTAMCTL